jgi:hypothetical protein
VELDRLTARELADPLWRSQTSHTLDVSHFEEAPAAEQDHRTGALNEENNPNYEEDQDLNYFRKYRALLQARRRRIVKQLREIEPNIRTAKRFLAGLAAI